MKKKNNNHNLSSSYYLDKMHTNEQLKSKRFTNCKKKYLTVLFFL